MTTRNPDQTDTRCRAHRVRCYGWRQLWRLRVDTGWPRDAAEPNGRGLVVACSVCLDEFP